VVHAVPELRGGDCSALSTQLYARSGPARGVARKDPRVCPVRVRMHHFGFPSPLRANSARMLCALAILTGTACEDPLPSRPGRDPEGGADADLDGADSTDGTPRDSRQASADGDVLDVGKADGHESCGQPAGACCDDGGCAGGALCEGQVCVPCGRSGQHCCADGSCASGDQCTADAGICTPCGDPGQVCCGANTCGDGGCCVSGYCGGAGEVCAFGDAGVCASGSCGGCGAAGQECCSTGCTAPSVACQGNQCALCGGAGEICCPDGSCSSGQVCQAGLCYACGASAGEPCCSGATCADGLLCLGSGVCGP
jgi:hypothetical protein